MKRSPVMRRPIPTITFSQIRILQKSGDLARIYHWLVQRIQEYQLQLDSEGDFGHEGELFAKGKVVLTLKRDLRNAIAKREFPPLPNAVIEHVVQHTLKKLTEQAMIQIRKLETEGSANQSENEHAIASTPR